MSIEQEVFTVEIPIAGTLAVGAGVLRYQIPVYAQCVGAVATVSTAPTGAAAIFTIKQNGSAITPNATLTVPIGANVSNSLAVAGSTTSTVTLTQGSFTKTDYTQVPVANAVPGDYFTVDVTQVGSTVAGANAVITLTFLHR